MLEEKLKDDGGFLYLQLLDRNKKQLSDNFYWYPNAEGKYTGLNKMKEADLKISAKNIASGKIEVTLTNPKGGPVAFFNRIALVDAKTGERILPVFFDDNYISVAPGESRSVIVEYYPQNGANIQASVYGWNVKEKVGYIK